MDGFFSTIRFFFGCGTLLVLAMVLVAHLPKSPLRASLIQVCGWATTALCGAYVVSPIDVVPDFLFPFGFIDDIGVLFIGIKAAVAAWNAGKEKAFMHEEEEKKAA